MKTSLAILYAKSSVCCHVFQRQSCDLLVESSRLQMHSKTTVYYLLVFYSHSCIYLFLLIYYLLLLCVLYISLYDDMNE